MEGMSAGSMPLPAPRARLLFAATVVVTAALPHVPFGPVIGWPLLLLSTLAHELGHGFTALIVGGNFESFRMWSDGSGVASWGGQPGRLQQALVSAGGLVGPAIAAAVFLVLGRRPRMARVCLALVAVVLLTVEVLLVRNVFGLFFVGATALAALAIARFAPPWLAQGALVFVAVQLALSVFTRADYLFTPTAVTSGGTMPSDVQQMADALFLPYWFWGAICGAFSVAVLLLGAKLFLTRQPA
jgi:hypothetical protein